MVENRLLSAGSRAAVLAAALLLALGMASPRFAHAADPPSHDPPMDPPSHHTGDAGPQHSKHGSMGSVGAKLADPTSDIWALQFNFQGPTFNDGDVNQGSPEYGGNLVIQPVMPIPLYGTGANEWKMITRPVIPIVFGQPIPRGGDEFFTASGLGDMALELLLAAPASATHLPKNLIFAAGLGLGFPTSTKDELGKQQFTAGPSIALGWKTPTYTAILFPTYFFSIGDRSDRKSSTPDTSQLSLLYEFVYNLPNAWQIGLNPTITYDHRAASGDKWNVPIGLFGSKTIMVGNTPLNIKAGMEYSVVSQDTFGKRFGLRFQITPIIPSLIKNPIFGGD
jgi:hypothetical protein